MYNFWDYHSVLFLICAVIFPRLTMLFATTIGGGFWYWLGWLFVPRLVIAIIATMMFSQVNIVLVVCAWIVFAIDCGVKKRMTERD